MDLPTLARSETSPSRPAWPDPAPGVRGREATDRGVPTPHVVAWNLTRRCNLACAHCYISAGSWEAESVELSTERCLGIVDQVLDVNPSPVLILSGGEPLLRDDLEEIAGHAHQKGATVVVGTNGTRLTSERIESLMAAGVAGVAVSVDSLRPAYHDRFRSAASRSGQIGEGAGGYAPHGAGALADTIAAVDRLRDHGLDFIVQTTVTPANRDELGEIAAWSVERGAVSFNVYFLVATGRGERVRSLAPVENDEVLRELIEMEARFRGRMMVRSKCQPQIMRHALEGDADSSLLNYGTRCPCGVHYLRITPEGKVTPCPYTPAVAGDLTKTPFRQIWESSPVFDLIRNGTLGGKCGRCEYREVCGGCRARAYAEGNGLMGADDSCAYEPDGTRDVVKPRRSVTYGAPTTGASGIEARGAGAPGAGAAAAEALDTEPALEWTDEARARVARIPSFVRGVVVDRVERFARERGYEVVDRGVMAEVRAGMPVDFSKRLPFFLRRDRDEGGADGGSHEDFTEEAQP